MRLRYLSSGLLCPRIQPRSQDTCHDRLLPFRNLLYDLPIYFLESELRDRAKWGSDLACLGLEGNGWSVGPPEDLEESQGAQDADGSFGPSRALEDGSGEESADKD